MSNILVQRGCWSLLKLTEAAPGLVVVFWG